MPLTTRAIGYEAALPSSDPSCLVEREVEVPELGPRDLLVKVAAVSVNPVDTWARSAVPPHDGFQVLGYDASGTVLDVGREVTLFAPGDEVFYAGARGRPGSNQRLQSVDERLVGRKPSTVSHADAASLPLAAITAWEGLFDRLTLSPSSTGVLLVVGATGGVGSVVLQLAEALLPGVTVVATASDDERAQWARSLGAEHTVNHRDDLVAQLAALSPGGVDWVFTAHSEGQVETYAKVVRPFGAIVAIDAGPRDVAPLMSKAISWHWELMFTRAAFGTADMEEQHLLLDRVSALVDAGRLRTTVTRALSPIGPQALREAHSLVESGRTVGKVVVHGWP